jgi:hypothetical protein
MTTRAAFPIKGDLMTEPCRSTSRVKTMGLAVVAVLLAATSARAEDRLGGHFGAVFPLVTHAQGETTDITDDFQVGFPMGITVKTSDKFAFDLELVPALNNKPLRVPLTVHPGALFGLGSHYTAGLRMAFDINSASWGFTPLLNKAFPQHGYAVFVEAVAPIRFQEDSAGESHTAVTFGVHVGLGF